MKRERWQQLLMARLYGEIDVDDAQAFDAHVAADPAARREWEAVRATRARLGQGAGPVPAPPRVWIVDRSAPRRAFGFAGGLAAAAAVFALGILVGWQALGSAGTSATQPTEVGAGGELSAAQLERALQTLGLEPAALRDAVESRKDLTRRQDALEAKLLDVPTATHAIPATAAGVGLTRAEFEEGLTRMMNRLEYARQQDLDYVLSELTRVEQRQDSRIETNQAALRYALQTMPGVTER